MRAVVIVSAEADAVEKYLRRCYGGPPEDPYPDVEQWFAEIVAEVAVPAMAEEVGHIPFKVEIGEA